MLWFQKSRTDWIASGYRNTAYFHRVATIHRQRNNVSCLLGDDGNFLYNESSLCNMVLAFYVKLYTNERLCHMRAILHDFFPISLDVMNSMTRAIDMEGVCGII